VYEFQLFKKIAEATPAVFEFWYFSLVVKVSETHTIV